MVARLEPTLRLSRILSYNEEKVAQGQAEFIHLKNFLQNKDSITYENKFERFQRLNELNTRANIKMLHATLNFQPSEKLSNTELSAIADRYMQGLQMEKHPYLVYHHKDAKHPHIHIVTSLIRPDGSRVDTHRMANRLSEPTRKAIEQEFQLFPAQSPKSSPVLQPDQVRKITAKDELPVTQSVDRILASVNKHYHFTNLYEYNAILRAYNVTAETGSPGSKTRRHAGIYYVALDEEGNKISPPMMASQLSSRPTLPRLQHKFHHPDADHLDHLASIRRRIDWALDTKPATLRQLVTRLQRDGIEIVVPPGNGRNPHDQIYVDHRTHTAVNGETLGRAYTTAAINTAIGHEQQASQRKHQTADLPPGTHFNASVPQLLSATLRTDPGAFGADDFSLGQSLGPRRKH
jgi:Relaxase/Mobilisation nuclease domain